MLTEDNKTLKGAVPTASRSKEIASGVYCLACGHGLPMSGIGTAPELRAFADHFR